MADEAKKLLQSEVMAVKQRWGDGIKLTKAKADAPKAPLPIGIQRTIAPPPDATAYDVDELKVKLWIDDLDSTTLPVRVEVDPAGLPAALVPQMASRVAEQWRTELRARGGGKGWMLEKVLGWCESKFVDLLVLDPRCVDTYQGCDENGMTIRRYALQEPPPESAGDAGEEEESEGEDSEDVDDEDPEVAKERERLLRIRLKAEEEADRQWREERRKEAEELGEDYKEKFVSKKEQQEALKAKQEKRQGARTRKEGAKHNKFDAEAAGAKKNKKNGLMH